jgi:hypothetical protein
MHRSVAIVLLAFGVACGASSQPPQASPPAAAAPPAPIAPAPVAAGSAAASELAPLPYTAEQIRAASPVGRVVRLRVEAAGKPTSIVVMTFVASDERGAEVESAVLDEHGAPRSAPVRQHATWDELRSHGAFPAAATRIEDGVAETPAGRFPSKIYTVTRGDNVSRFYFAVDRAGPPVLFYTDVAGVRQSTTTLLANDDPPAAAPPIACKTDDDCWLDDRTPIARPAAKRGKRLRPCKDAEAVPRCKASVCVAEAYKC